MTSLTLILVLITGLFGVALVAKKFLPMRLCAICAAASGSWIALLLLRGMDIAVDPVLLGLLIGQSVVGVYYLVEKRVPESWQLFRLPFLLSLTLLGYSAVAPSPALWSAYGYLALLWLVFIALFTYRRSPKLAKMAANIIECCKNW